MNRCTDSFPLKISLIHLTFLIALLALPTYAQTRSAGPYREVALKTATPCTVGTVGELRWLVKNNVELSVNEDWDCDGVADAYDNCVGLPNPAQTDTDRNRIGDTCEAAATVRAGPPAKSRSTAKTTAKEKTRAEAKPEREKTRREAKSKTRKPVTLAKNTSNKKDKTRKPPPADRRSRPTSKTPRR